MSDFEKALMYKEYVKKGIYKTNKELYNAFGLKEDIWRSKILLAKIPEKYLPLFISYKDIPVRAYTEFFAKIEDNLALLDKKIKETQAYVSGESDVKPYEQDLVKSVNGVVSKILRPLLKASEKKVAKKANVSLNRNAKVVRKGVIHNKQIDFTFKADSKGDYQVKISCEDGASDKDKLKIYEEIQSALCRAMKLK